MPLGVAARGLFLAISFTSSEIFFKGPQRILKTLNFSPYSANRICRMRKQRPDDMRRSCD